MHRNRAALPSLLALLFIGAACGTFRDDVSDRIDDTRIDLGTQRDAAKARVLAAVIDELHCAGLVHADTSQLIADALESHDYDPLELAASPEELGRMVAAMAVSNDSTLRMTANTLALVYEGYLGSALASGFDTLTCDAADTFVCTDVFTGDTGGSGTTTVECDGASNVTAVGLGFDDQCVLAASTNQGSVRFDRTGPTLAFDSFQLASGRLFDGDITVTATGSHLEASTTRTLTVTADAGFSCEEVIAFNRLVVDEQTGSVTVGLDISRTKEGKTYGVRTGGTDAVWARPWACQCPQPGSVVEMTVPQPVGGSGTAEIRVTYVDAPTAAHCAGATVELLTWPDDCGLSSITDCGRASVEGLLGPLLSATCVAVAP